MAAVFLLASARSDDLCPVTAKEAPRHDPVAIARDGQAVADVCLMVSKPSATLSGAVQELLTCLELTTGAKFKLVKGGVSASAIVIGDCPEAAALGLDGSKMPFEGFEIRTAPGRVFIVGRDGWVDEASRTATDGTAWGVFEFLERFAGVRWYWPAEQGGRSTESRRDLAVPPAWVADAPVFRKREIWPPAGSSPYFEGSRSLRHISMCLRAADSWPVKLVVHTPRDWDSVEEFRKNRPEVFQLNADGTRNYQMLCYGNPRTLQTYLEEISRYYDQGDRKAHIGIRGNAITVSPNDMGVSCYCRDCRKLWDPAGGQYGTASRILADFTARLAAEVKRRWPGKTVIFLPYSNYTVAPEGIKFPDNVEIQLCGMPGIATFKEPSIAASEQANVDRWAAASGRPIQDWHYSCWPADRIQAPFQYPHVLKTWYQHNRAKTVGSFINGDHDHWPRHHISLYAWAKVLWNPDFDVDAALDEYCRRMYGPASATVRRIVQIETDGWEQSRWPDGRLSPRAVYEQSYPRASVEEMKQLLERARKEAAGDQAAAGRLEYFAACFPRFLQEFSAITEGTGQRSLVIQKVAEQPVIDGRLDDAVWEQAQPIRFVKAEGGKEVEPKYPTELRAVFTLDGVAFGFRMAEPAPDQLKRDVTAADHALTWHDDCVEIFLDVSGQNLGRFVQFVINANGAVQDARDGQFTWNAEGLKIARHFGRDFWSMEVYIPFSTLGPDARGGTGVKWFGQFTRHRVGDARKTPGSIAENQKLNAAFGGYNSNLADFAPVVFRE